jgi:ankyrin repeat protein
MKLLLARGATVNQLSSWKYSALHAAAQFRDSTEAIRLLLEHGAQVRVAGATPTANASPLFFAAHVGNTAALPLLRQAGDRLDETTFLFGSSPYTPLTAAATYGHLDAVRALLDLKASIDGDGGTRSPLSVAVGNHHLGVVRLLLERGADVNRADKDGRTPLHYAAAVDFGDTAIAELLLKAGARADLPDKQGVTARQMAEQSNRRIVPLLAGANGAAPLKTAFVGASAKQL